MKKSTLLILSLFLAISTFAQNQANPSVNGITLQSNTTSINGRETILYQITNASSLIIDPNGDATIPPNALEVTISFPIEYGIDMSANLDIPYWQILSKSENQLLLTNENSILTQENSTIAVSVIGKLINSVPQATTLTVTVSDQFPYVSDLDAGDNVNQAYFSVTSTPLPIRLVTFGAKMLACNEVNVAWETSSESNVSHYEVEYSTIGNSFVAVAQVAAKNQANTYQTSLFQKESLGFYRLKSVDLDGKYSYSKIAQVQLAKCADAFYKVLPNPSNGVYTIKGENIAGLVQVMDITGKVIYSMNYDNLNQAKVDIITYPAGTYQMRVITQNGNVLAYKLLKL